MRSFSHLLKLHVERSGISDAELARAIGVRRQTVFRWKEGSVARPRSREDVIALSQKLRLSATETDELLLAAGFHPEGEIKVGVDTSVAAAPRDQVQPPQSQPVPDTPPKPTESDMPKIAGRRHPGVWQVGLGVAFVLAVLIAGWLLTRPALPVAAPDETLVVIGQFTNFVGSEVGFNVAGRIADLLRQEFEGAGLPGVRVAIWPRGIRSEAEAQVALVKANAWMVIWGEYDSGRVLTRFAQRGAQEPLAAVESLVASSDELFATINSALPQEVRYLALLTLGEFYVNQSNFGQARLVLDRAYAAPPTERDARITLLFRLGLVYQLGTDAQQDRAIRYYTDLLELAADHLLARYNRGLAYLARNKTGDLDRALVDFDGVIRRNPGFLSPRIGRGVVYLYRQADGDDDRAMQDFSYTIQQDDQRVMAFYNRGLLAIRQGDRSLWESDLQRAIELAPEFAGSYSALCWGYVLDNEAIKALPLCDQAIAMGAQEALHSRGMAHIQQAAFAPAQIDLQAFLDWLDTQPAGSPYRVYMAQVREWLASLEQSIDPLTPDILAGLR